MPSILCSNARAPVAQLVRASDLTLVQFRLDLYLLSFTMVSVLCVAMVSVLCVAMVSMLYVAMVSVLSRIISCQVKG